MYCKKCGIQLQDKVLVCSGCGSAVECVQEPSVPLTLTQDTSGLRLTIFPIIIAALYVLSILLLLLFRPFFADLPYEVFEMVIEARDTLNITQPVLWVIFCIPNFKLPFHLATKSLIAILISQILRIIVFVESRWGYHWVTDVKTFSFVLSTQYALFSVVFFISIGLFLLALKHVVSLTDLQKIMRTMGIILSFGCAAWIMLIRFPFQLTRHFEDVLINGNGMLQVCYNIYQPFAPIMEKGLILSLIGSILYLAIAISLYRTEKVEVL